MPIVKALLVIAKGEGGNDLYLYQGSEVPTLADGELERLSEYFESEEKPEPKQRASKVVAESDK